MEATNASIEDMATAAGIQAGTMKKILSGDIKKPPQKRIEGFATVLGVSVDELLAYRDNKTMEAK